MAIEAVSAGELDKALKAALGERRVKLRQVSQISPETAGRFRRSVIEFQTWHQLRGHELTQPVGPAYFRTLLALALRPAFRPSPIFLANSLRFLA